MSELRNDCWRISLGLKEVKLEWFRPRESAFVKLSMDRVDINAENDRLRKALIEKIKVKLLNGIENYQILKSQLLDEKSIAFEKHNDDGIYYVSRQSLSNHIRTARESLGLRHTNDKEKILKMFDSGFSRSAIEIAGFNKANVFSVLFRNNRIQRKKRINDGKSE